jgi:hypothetical protein
VPRQFCVRAKSLTLAVRLAMLHAMRPVVRMVTAIRLAVWTRRDLLLEILALRHQLAVLTRSNRRFRPSDRLLWLTGRSGEARWCWFSRPRSSVGIAIRVPGAGGVIHDVLEDHALMHSLVI